MIQRGFRIVVHDGREDGPLEDTVNFFLRGETSDQHVELVEATQVVIVDPDNSGWWIRTTLFFLVVTT